MKRARKAPSKALHKMPVTLKLLVVVFIVHALFQYVWQHVFH